jgi:hypothetical protein
MPRPVIGMSWRRQNISMTSSRRFGSMSAIRRARRIAAASSWS